MKKVGLMFCTAIYQDAHRVAAGKRFSLNIHKKLKAIKLVFS
jgi:hypothetical protein